MGMPTEVVTWWKDGGYIALDFKQRSQFCTVPAGNAGIYHSGQCTGTDNPLISYRKKYRPYRLRNNYIDEIRLFRPINGYQAETSFVRKENREEGEMKKPMMKQGWRREAIASSSSFLFFFFFSVGLSVSLSFFFFFFAEPFFLLLLYWSVRLPLLFFFFFFFFFSVGSVCLPLMFCFC